MAQKLISDIIRQLKAIQNQPLWVGDNFEDKIESISPEEAFVQPHEKLFSVAQLLAHITAWNKDAELKIEKGVGRVVTTHEQDWPSNEYLKSIGWPQVFHEFHQSLNSVIELLQEKDDVFLTEQYKKQPQGESYSYQFLMDGILHHHLYHLGQIGIVIKFLKT